MISDDEVKSALWKFGYSFKLYWKSTFTIIWPLILLSLFIEYENSPNTKCGYVVLVMVGYWVTQCLPVGVTSLLPLLLFPCLDILNFKDTGTCYINDAIMLFIGSLIFATAIEDSNLHMRIALKVMQVFSYDHYYLIAGVILVTYFLSMWITSTAATATMVPIVLAVLGEFEREGLGNVFVNTESLGNQNNQPKPSKLTLTYLMGTAYAAIFGGSSTLIGSASNLAFKGIFEKIFLCAPKIGFGQWMMFAVPLSLLNLCFTWIYVVSFLFFATLPTNDQNAQSYAAMKGQIRNVIKRVMKAKSESLGKMTSHELGVAIMFVLFVILLVTREPGFMPGWTSILPGKEIPDSTPIFVVSLLMFFIPKDLKFLHVCTSNRNKRPTLSSESLVAWKSFEVKLSWSLMLLLGSGFAISEAMVKSRLALMLEDAMRTTLLTKSWWYLLLIICIVVGIVANITPNVVTANIVLPIIASVSTSARVSPLFLMIPATFMCSYSFCSPLGSPFIAIIRNSGHMSLKRLILGGLAPAIYSLLFVMHFYLDFGANYVYQNGIKFQYWAELKNYIDKEIELDVSCDYVIRY